MTSPLDTNRDVTAEIKAYDPMPILRMGIWVVVVGFMGFMVWASVTHLARGAHVSGRIVVESSKKIIQHREGGIVREIHVSEGQFVEKGQLLVVLDSLVAKANIDDQAQRLARDRMIEARLLAEISGSEKINFPDNPKPSLISSQALEEMKRDQLSMFERRRHLLSDQLKQAEARIAQLKSQAKSNVSEIDGAKRNIDILIQRLSALKPLVAEGLYPRNQFLELEGSKIRAATELASREQEMVRLNEALAEAAQARNVVLSQYRQQVVEQINDVRARINTYQEQIKVQKDTLDRTRIIAPVAGQIIGLSVHTIGGVVTPGQQLMGIVPGDDRLIIEANVSPLDVDVMHPGMITELRFISLPQRRAPLLQGTLASISRDVMDPSDNKQSANKGTGYYVARIEVAANEIKKLNQAEIVPGMPVDVLINAGERRVIDYIIAPWVDLFSRAMRED